MYKRKKGKGGHISRQWERRGGRVLEDTYMPSVQREPDTHQIQRREAVQLVGLRKELFSFLQLSLPPSNNISICILPVSLPETHTLTQAQLL